MTVIVNVDEYVLETLKENLTLENEEEDILWMRKLKARLEELDNRFIEIESLKEFGELIEELRNNDLKVDVSYSSHFEDFSLYVEFE